MQCLSLQKSGKCAGPRKDSFFGMHLSTGTQLQADSLLLEGHIKALHGSMGEMTEHPSNKSRMYVTNDDIIKLSTIGEDVVFAVTAPFGTSLVVPDPDEGVEQGGERRYRYMTPISVLVQCTHSLPRDHSQGWTPLLASF